MARHTLLGAPCLLAFSLLAAAVTQCESGPICVIEGNLQTYNDTLFFCCENILHTNGLGAACCYDAEKVYFPETTVCCGQRTFDKYDKHGNEYGCCDGTRIRRDKQICCEDKTHRLPKEGSEHMECCGPDLINRTVDICCRNQQHPELVNRHARLTGIACCGHLVIDSTEEQCYWKERGSPVVVGINQAWCAGKVINLREQTCCNDVIYDEPQLNPLNMKELNPRVRCCGTTGFDPTKGKCCLYTDPVGVIIPNKEHLQCCHGGPGNSQGYFNESSELCCEGNTIARTSSRDQCCGSQSISGASQGCCNNQPFDLETEFCCEGFPSTVMSKAEESVCCGGGRLGENSLCCGGTSVLKAKPSDDSCCLNTDLGTFTYKTYTNRTMTCYNGRVERRVAPGYSVCAGRRFLPSRAVCCNDVIYEFPTGDTIGCCEGDDLNETPFSQKHQICCHGKIYNMSENDSECCGDKAYNKMADNNPCTERCGESFHHKERTICCGGRVFEKATDGDACCGSEPYFSNTSSCCQSKLYHQTSGRCCGALKYNQKTHRCCGNFAVMQRESKTERCCKKFMPFNKKHGRCLRNKLVKSKKRITPLKNICRKKTWRNLSGIQLDACFRPIAVRCQILKMEFVKESSTAMFTMSCMNLKRPFNPRYHKSFAVQDKSDRLQLSVTSSRKMKCSKKSLVGKKVLMFLQQQATKVSDRLYTLSVQGGDWFRVIEDKRQTREMIKTTVTTDRCEQIRELMSGKQKRAFFKYRAR